MNENNLVVKANKFIEAKGRMTTLEQKLIAGLISEISPEDENFKEYDLSISELRKELRITDTRVYETLRETANNLMKKEIVLEELTPKGKKKFIVTRIIASAEYVEGEGHIKITFAPVLKPYFLGLRNQFTKYQLKHILNLKGSHSIRIYELLKQYERIGKREFEVKVLKELLGVGEGYERFYDFERYVLKPAKKEINEKTDIWIDYKKIKEGRRIAKLKFEIESKFISQENEEIESYKENGVFDFDGIRKSSGLENERFSDKQILKLYEIACEKTENSNKSPFDYIKYYYNDMVQRDTANSRFGYLKNSLKKDYLNFLTQVTFDDIL